MLENNNIKQTGYYDESFHDTFNEEDFIINKTKKEIKNRKSQSSLCKTIADKLIEEIDIHPFLSLKKDDDELLYSIEKNKFSILCYNYTLFRYKKQTQFNPPYSIDPETFCFDTDSFLYDCPCSDVIYDTIISAIEHYKSETGNKFSHYYNVVIDKNLGINRSDNSIKEKTHGTIPEKDNKSARKVLALANNYCRENNIPQDEISQKSEEIKSMIHQNSDLGKKNIESAFKTLYGTKFVSGDAPLSDDDATSAMSNQEDPNQNVEEMIEQKLVLKEYGKVIDKVVKATQARTAPTIKAYMTNRIYNECPDLIDEFTEFDFFDKEFAKEIVINLTEKNSVFTNKEIADRFSVSGANITKIVRTFEKRMDEELKKVGLK